MNLHEQYPRDLEFIPKLEVNSDLNLVNRANIPVTKP